jgi:hypothetical protein
VNAANARRELFRVPYAPLNGLRHPPISDSGNVRASE